MPAQTSNTSYIYFPDGAKVSIKASGDVSYTDLGAINSAVTATLNYDENQVETANAGKLRKQINNMTIDGAFTLINLDADGIEKLGGGLFEVVDTAGSATTDIPDQVIAAGWSDNTLYPLVMETSSTDDTPLRTSAQPTLTSVTLGAGSPETLVEDTEYVVIADENSFSGWSIQFISGNMSSTDPEGYAITINYGSNTPIASTTVYAGTSTATLTSYAMKVTHTDSNSKVRQLELYSVDPNSGGFQFNFKGANEDGVEEMPLSFTARIDTSKTDGRQLFAWSVDSGAE